MGDGWRAGIGRLWPVRTEYVLKVDADEDGAGGEEAVGALRYLAATTSRKIRAMKLIQYLAPTAETNDASAWRSLEFLQLPASPYLWMDKSDPVRGQRFYRARVIPTPASLVFIPPGRFRMGSPPDEAGRCDWEGPQTELTIRRGFLMGKCFRVVLAPGPP